MSKLIAKFKQAYANDKATRSTELGDFYDQSVVFVVSFFFLSPHDANINAAAIKVEALKNVIFILIKFS